MDHPQNIAPVPEQFHGLRVLLVDNNTELLLDVAQKLEQFSYRVTTTELSDIALSIFQERKDNFDLVIADMEMPEMECLEFVKSVQLIKDLPVILMGSDNKRDVFEQAIDKGVCFFLGKPPSLEQLKNVWQHVLRKGNKTKTDNNQQSQLQGDELSKDNEPAIS